MKDFFLLLKVVKILALLSQFGRNLEQNSQRDPKYGPKSLVVVWFGCLAEPKSFELFGQTEPKLTIMIYMILFFHVFKIYVFSVIYHVFSFLFYQPFEPEFPIESVGSTICKLSLYLVSINKNIVATFFCSLSLPAFMNLLVFFISGFGPLLLPLD